MVCLDRQGTVRGSRVCSFFAVTCLQICHLSVSVCVCVCVCVRAVAAGRSSPGARGQTAWLEEKVWRFTTHHDPDPWEDPKHRTPDFWIEVLLYVGYRTLLWIYFLDPPRGLGSHACFGLQMTRHMRPWIAGCCRILSRARPVSTAIANHVRTA